MNHSTHFTELASMIRDDKPDSLQLHDLMKAVGAMKGRMDAYVLRMLDPDGDGGEQITQAEADEFKQLVIDMETFANFAVHLTQQSARKYEAARADTPLGGGGRRTPDRAALGA